MPDTGWEAGRSRYADRWLTPERTGSTDLGTVKINVTCICLFSIYNECMCRMRKKDRLQEILEELDRLLHSGDWSRRIRLHREALTLFSKDSDPKLWVKMMSDLAFCQANDTHGVRSQNIEEAIHCYELVLDAINRKEQSKEWASAKNNLATAYRNRVLEDRAENIEKAIQHYEDALEERSRDAGSESHIMTRNNLGNTYMVRIHGEHAQNIEHAILHYSKALEGNILRLPPGYRASLHYNVGDAYRCRIRGDQTENIEKAIRHFHHALKVHKRTAFPKEWAQARNNLGNAYLARICGNRAANIERAISHIYQALTVYTEQTTSTDWSGAQNNLGNAYLARINGERMENIDHAIGCYKNALTVRTREIHPDDWAQTMSNLAGAERTRANENIESSIQRLHETLEVRTFDAHPRDWAETQNNLAIAYTDRIHGDRAENIQQAIQHYEQALEVYALGMPSYCLRTARALGNLAFEQQHYELARKNYQRAFDARDILLHESFSRASKQTELGEAQNLPPRAAYACVKCNDVKGAIAVLEKGRAQLMRESLERRWLEELPGLGFKDLYEQYTQAAKQYESIERMNGGKNAGSDDLSLQVKQASDAVQTALVAIREKVGKEYPQYRYFMEALPLDEMRSLARDSLIVYLCSTSAGGLALIVDGNKERAIELPGLDQVSLQKHMWSPTDKEVDRINVHINKQHEITSDDILAVSGGYFSAYSLWSLSSFVYKTPAKLLKELTSAWFKALDKMTGWLWKAGIGKLVEELKKYNRPIILIPAGQLAMLPLHAAWTEDLSRPTGRLYALDKLNINYVPSAHALWYASLSAGRPAATLLAVDNPDGTLAFAEKEVRAITSLLTKHTHLQGRQATVAAVKKAMLDANILHFATHGNAGWQEEEQARLKLADGYLTLPNIFDLKLDQARLAVLSACETGVPSLKLIDEMFSLPAGMMQAGVPGVVGSLWSVNDMSTALLMIRFYIAWQKENYPPQEALCIAQAWLRDDPPRQKKDFLMSFIEGKHSGLDVEIANSFHEYLSFAEPEEIDYSSPYYWAAFTYTGV